MDSSPKARLQRALDSLEGLSLGDAFGEQFFPLHFFRAMVNEGARSGFNEDELNQQIVAQVRARREPATAKWEWTDDTALALEVVAELQEHERINPDTLARRYSHQPTRGYGMAMYSLLPRLQHENWRQVASELFDGKGSYGNGSAMRVPPLGAYFADDFDLLVEQARLSAIVTHSHEEAIAGAIATSVAAGICARLREEGTKMNPLQFLSEIIKHTPKSEVKTRLIRCWKLPSDATAEQVASLVGSGSLVACHDTVPFCCWCAAKCANDFREAMWGTVTGLGDRDTTCAIVGGIVGARVGKKGLPPSWMAKRESLVWI